MKWQIEATLRFKDPVTDLKFAPYNGNLNPQLAISSLSGEVIVNEGSIIGEWTKHSEFLTNQMGTLCFDWSNSIDESPMVVVGGHDGSDIALHGAQKKEIS